MVYRGTSPDFRVFTRIFGSSRGRQGGAKGGPRGRQGGHPARQGGRKWTGRGPENRGPPEKVLSIFHPLFRPLFRSQPLWKPLSSMVGIASITVQHVEKSHNGNPLRFQNNIPNNLKKLRCISPVWMSILVSTLALSHLRIRGAKHRIIVNKS